MPCTRGFLFFAFGIATVAGQQGLTAATDAQAMGAGGLNTSQLLFSSLGFGFSLAVNAWCWYRVSGGLFNPAVTLGLFLTGTLSWYRSIFLMIAQFSGAIAAAGLAELILPGKLGARTRLSASTSIPQGFFLEFFLTAELVFAVFMLAGEKHKGTFLAPVGIGLALFIGELLGTYYTGGSLNPARSLGPDVIAATFDGSAWIYYAAPFSGAIIASVLYTLLKFFRYETVVPEQDRDDIHMLIRNTQGQLMGHVDQVTAADAPDLAASHASNSRPPTPSGAAGDMEKQLGLVDPAQDTAAGGTTTMELSNGTTGVPAAAALGNEEAEAEVPEMSPVAHDAAHDNTTHPQGIQPALNL